MIGAYVAVVSASQFWYRRFYCDLPLIFHSGRLAGSRGRATIISKALHTPVGTQSWQPGEIGIRT